MIHLSIITPEEVAFTGEAESITIPTAAGEITVLTGHIPWYPRCNRDHDCARRKGGEQFSQSPAGGGGGAQHHTHFGDIADRVESLEEDAIEQAKQRAEEVLRSSAGETTKDLLMQPLFSIANWHVSRACAVAFFLTPSPFDPWTTHAYRHRRNSTRRRADSDARPPVCRRTGLHHRIAGCRIRLWWRRTRTSTFICHRCSFCWEFSLR